MIKRADYIIVGCGLTGAAIARQLHEAGNSVRIVEQRAHIGGNVYDGLHACGIRFHHYGPHYFRTDSEPIWQFVTRYGEFYPYQAVIKSYARGRMFSWPLHRREVMEHFGDCQPQQAQPVATNFEQAMLAQLARPVYETFIGAYSEKQWGVPPQQLTVDLAGRIELRESGEQRLKTSRYQGIPLGGYTRWFERLLAGIDIDLEVDFLSRKEEYRWNKKLIYTGPIDRFFGCCHGRLAYRAQQRSHLFLPQVEQALPCGQVNYPQWQEGVHIRAIEWRHMLAPGEYNGSGTLITTETPYTPQSWLDLEYPCPEQASRDRYARYRAMAKQRQDLVICGRLGEYRYLDMDQALARALYLARKLLAA